MLSSRPLPSKNSLDDRFQVTKQLNVTDGTMNAGIFVVRDIVDKQICIKKDFRRKDIERGTARSEIQILRSLKHVHVVDYIHAYLEEDPQVCKASLYMELCEYGSLDDFVDRHSENDLGIGESAVWCAFKQLAKAIGYIQYGSRDIVNGGHCVAGWQKILHRDLVPRNVFLKKVADHPHPKILLGDFGRAQIVESTYEEVGGHYEMPDAWMRAPESPSYGPASEIYSLARVILSMCQVQGHAERYGPPINPETYWEDGGKNHYSNELGFLIKACMDKDRRRRPNIRQLGPKLGIYSEKARYNPDWEYPKWDVRFDYPW
jgi:serine/threonine protein kinase